MIPIARPMIGEEEKRAVLEVLESGMLAQGSRVEAFEHAFAAMCGATHAIATSSGTTALHVALLAHGIGPGDEVITTPFTFIASANSILYVGAKPVFVDIEPSSFNLDPTLVERAITPRTRALLPVHLFGLPCDMAALSDIATLHGLAIIEDACQAHGAEHLGHRVGSFGTACFSLYPTKNITSAEGGMVTTMDDAVAERCRLLRQHGMRRRYYHDEIGYNFRMTDVHAAIGLEQLHKLERFNAARAANTAFYNQHLCGVTTPVVPEGYHHVYHQYTIRVPDGKRDALAEYLQQQGIGTGIYYPVPIHQQTYYTERLGYRLHLPEAERAAREVLSLPIHPSLSRSDLETVVTAVNTYMGS